MSAPVFVEDEGVNSGAEVEGVEAMVYVSFLVASNGRRVFGRHMR